MDSMPLFYFIFVYFFVVLRVEPSALYMLDKRCATKLQPQPCFPQSTKVLGNRLYLMNIERDLTNLVLRPRVCLSAFLIFGISLTK